MTKTKILIYTKDPNGGIGKFLENLLPILQSNRQYQVLVLSNILQKNTDIPIKVVGTSTSKLNSLNIHQIGKTIKNIIHLWNEVNNFKPDIIISIDLYANILIAILNFNTKYCHIMNTHVNLLTHISYDRNKLITFCIKQLIKYTYNNADHHIVPSQELRKQLVKKFSIPATTITAILNPLDIDKVRKLSREKNNDNAMLSYLKQKKSINIFSIGRFEKQKNFELLLETFAKLSRKYSNLQLFILGSGSLLSHYKLLIKDLKLKNIFFIGWKKNPYQYLRYADLFILLSKYEGFPYTVLEAQALHVPIVASDVDFGPRELLEYGKYGILLKNNEINHITRQFAPLLSNPQKLKKLKTLSIQAIQQYKKKTIHQDYLNIISEISNQCSKRK